MVIFWLKCTKDLKGRCAKACNESWVILMYFHIQRFVYQNPFAYDTALLFMSSMGSILSRKPETQICEKKREKSNIVDNSGEEENKSRNFKIVNFRFLHHGRKLLLSQVIHIYSLPIYVLNKSRHASSLKTLSY